MVIVVTSAGINHRKASKWRNTIRDKFQNAYKPHRLSTDFVDKRLIFAMSSTIHNGVCDSVDHSKC